MLFTTLAMLIIMGSVQTNEHGFFFCKEAQGLIHGKNTKFIVVRIPFKTRANHELWMRKEAASAFIDLVEMAVSHGYEIKLNSAYRTYKHQMRLWKEMPNIAGDPTKGGSRTHQTGLSIDIAGTIKTWKGEQRKTLLYWFLKRFAKDFQFYNNVSTEPWHWTYMGTLQNKTNQCSKLKSADDSLER